jgi:hypothetical protein
MMMAASGGGLRRRRAVLLDDNDSSVISEADIVAQGRQLVCDARFCSIAVGFASALALLLTILILASCASSYF